MFVDSHCHIDFPDFHEGPEPLLANMRAAEVSHALCVSVSLERLPGILALAESHDNIFASVGVHPDHEDATEPDVESLVSLAAHPRVIAIGETGLDYYRKDRDSASWQRERFRVHIRVACQMGLPLIIHTRNAAVDTLRILKEEGADTCGGVMHCFTESWDVAKAALDLGLFISFSGIITFKNAIELREVARQVPMDRLLIETDAPYLAPVPYRGQRNEPAFVRHVAELVAGLRGITTTSLGEATSRNFFSLFTAARSDC